MRCCTRKADGIIGLRRIDFLLTHAINEASAGPVTVCQLLEDARRIGASAAVRAEQLDVDGAFPDADVRDLHHAALLLAPFPVGIGGCALGSPACDPLVLLDVLVAIGRGSLSLGRLYEGHVNAVKLVTNYGTPANLEHLRAEALAGRPSGVWMAEAGEPLVLEETAAGLVLRGRKVLASGSGRIQRPLVAARTEAGSVMVLPRVQDFGRTDTVDWTVHGMRATATGTVDFTGIRIDSDEIVGRPDDYMTSPLFRGGAWRVIAVQLGGVEAIMDLYTAQLAGSRGLGDPLQLARMGDALIAAETARLWVGKACHIAEGDTGSPAAIDAYVDLARNAFEQSALRVISCAQKAIGLRAFTRPNPLERVIRDLTTYMRQPGLDGSLTSAAAHHLGTERRS